MMYWLYRKHHWKPLDFFNMGNGERTIIEAFIRQEQKDIKEEIKKMIDKLDINDILHKEILEVIYNYLEKIKRD